MKELITIRIYFEYGQKNSGHSFWKRIYAADFATELMKRAKSFGLHQVLHLNINKGYLNNQKIIWRNPENRHHKHPHLIEITDLESKINEFLYEEENFLKEAKVLMVKNEMIIK